MQKVIFLVDMNAFFISCEMARNPHLKGQPAAVAGDPKNRSGIILAANYEARSYGVKTTMVLHEAKKICPRLILVPPDHSLYSEESKKVMSILSRYSPVIQKNSIDEAWVDMTGTEALFGKPREIAEAIMKDIQDELDLGCSIGISYNKFLAKMASEFKKPKGITEIWEKDMRLKIWPLPVRDMYGVGKQTEKKLINVAIFTIGDLANSDPILLRKILGKSGEDLHHLANGIDLSVVEEKPSSISKSVSRSTTLSKDIIDLEHAKTVIFRLAEEVGAEARIFEGKGKTVSIVIKYSDFKSITRQKTVTPTFLTKEINKAGIDLLEENWDIGKPVRLLGIGLSNFSEEESFEQLSLDSLKEGSSLVKEEKLEKTMDKIKQKFGSDKIKRAKLIQ